MTLRERFLDQFDDPKRRREESALTDPLQTHLSERDLRGLGGDRDGE